MEKTIVRSDTKNSDQISETNPNANQQSREAYNQANSQQKSQNNNQIGQENQELNSSLSNPSSEQKSQNPIQIDYEKQINIKQVENFPTRSSEEGENGQGSIQDILILQVLHNLEMQAFDHKSLVKQEFQSYQDYYKSEMQGFDYGSLSQYQMQETLTLHDDTNK